MMKLKRNLTWGMVTCAAGFALLQLTNPARTNPPVINDMVAASAPPTHITAMLHAACYDCHSSETRWPWYSHVAPMSWLIVSDVREGRDRLNLSEWPTDAKRAARRLENMSSEISSGDMPLVKYTKMHADARLTEAQRKELAEWLDGEAVRVEWK